MTEPLLTIRRVAEILNRSYGTTMKLIHSGELPHVKLPGSREYLVDPRDLQALIDRSNSGAFPGALTLENVAQPCEKTAPKKRCRAGEVYPDVFTNRVQKKGLTA